MIGECNIFSWVEHPFARSLVVEGFRVVSPLLSLRLMLSSCLKKGVVIGSVSIYFSVMFMVEFIFRELQIQSVYIFRHGDD